MKKHSLNRFFSIMLAAVMIAALLPFMPDFTGKESLSGGAVYAASNDDYLAFENVGIFDSHLTLNISAGTAGEKLLAYSYDKITWAEFTIGPGANFGCDLNIGEKVYLAAGTVDTDGSLIPGKNAAFSSDANTSYYYFTIGTNYDSGTRVIVSGNLISLLDGTCQSTALSAREFRYLFKNNSAIIDASELKLPAAKLADYCYSYMFSKCTHLRKAPELLAATLPTGCYSYMFIDCYELDQVVAHFTEWGKGTTAWLGNNAGRDAANPSVYAPGALTVPDSRSQDNIPEGWALKDLSQVPAPEVKANALDPDLDYFAVTFSGNTSPFRLLIKKNGSPASINLQCSKDKKHWVDFTAIQDSFVGADGVDLYKGETLYIAAGANGENGTNAVFSSSDTDYYSFYRNSFGSSGISLSGNIMSLLDSTCKSTSLSDYEFYNLFADLGTYLNKDIVDLKLPSKTLAAHCYEGMFKGTSIKTAPELPATNLAEYCYSHMFDSCTNMAGPVDLPAAALKKGCYSYMFYDCKAMTNLSVHFTDWTNYSGSEFPTYEWLGINKQTAWAGTMGMPSALSKTVPATTDRSRSSLPENWNTALLPVSAAEIANYYISFDAAQSLATVNGFPQGVSPDADSVVIKANDGNGTDVTNTAVNGISFTYGKDKYKITFEINGDSYTLHANCNVKDVKIAVDTAGLDDAIAEADELAAKEFPEVFNDRSTRFIVGGSTSVGVFVPIDANTTLSGAIGAARAVKNAYTTKDQVEIDAAASSLYEAIAEFESSEDVYIMQTDESYATFNSNLTPVDVEYAYGLYADKSDVPNGGLKTFGGNISAQDGVNLITVFADVVDTASGKKLNKTVYTVLGYSSFAEGFKTEFAEFIENNGKAQAKISEYGTAYSECKDCDELLDMALAAVSSKSSDEPGHDPAPGPQPVYKNPLDQFVSFAISGSSISWKAINGADIISIAYTSDVISDEDGAMASKYLPLPKGAASVEALSGGEQWFKVLVKVGGVSKTYYKPVTIEKCSGPAVVELSSAIGVYSRGTNPKYVAYAKGDFDTIVDAVSAALSAKTTVYYVSDGAALDKTAFDSGVYTFFFEEAAVKITISK